MSRHNSRSGLFLMEIMAVILFFSICAAVCTSVFAKASLLSEKSSQLTAAASRAANIAEIYKSCGGNINETARLLDDASGDNQTAENILTEKNQTSAETLRTVYKDTNSDMLITLEKAPDGLAVITAAVTDNEGTQEIFTMSVRTKEGE